MLKSMGLILSAFTLFSCSRMALLSSEQQRDAMEFSKSVRIVKSQMRAMAEANRPILRDRMPGMPFGFDRPWVVGEDSFYCYLEVYNVDKDICKVVRNANVGAVKVLVNGSSFGFCSEVSTLRFLFVKFPAFDIEEYHLDINYLTK